MRMIDLTGKIFGRLTVLSLEGELNGHLSWRCKCECGAEKDVRGKHLRYGNVKSCGCFNAEETSKRRRTHGESKRTSEYSIWCSMIARCENHAVKAFKDYGGRGISVCARWRSSFAAFLEDMGRHPPRLTLDRIDNDGNYEPGNCRWATRKEQNNNTRATQRKSS